MHFDSEACRWVLDSGVALDVVGVFQGALERYVWTHRAVESVELRCRCSDVVVAKYDRYLESSLLLVVLSGRLLSRMGMFVGLEGCVWTHFEQLDAEYAFEVWFGETHITCFYAPPIV